VTTDRRFSTDPTLHQGMVHEVARRFCTPGTSDYDDLVQAGNLGLLRAAEKYDVARGFQFNTYAKWWIRAFIDKERGRGGAVQYTASQRRWAQKQGWHAPQLCELEGNEPAEPAELFLDRDNVRRALVAVCTPHERKALELVYIKGMRQSAAAKVMGCSGEWVRILKTRALAKLRAELRCGR
jgi:RNA polymerase sigma factor (sigma-70 family)